MVGLMAVLKLAVISVLRGTSVARLAGLTVVIRSRVDESVLQPAPSTTRGKKAANRRAVENKEAKRFLIKPEISVSINALRNFRLDTQNSHFGQVLCARVLIFS